MISTTDFFVIHLSHFCLNRYATLFMQGIKMTFLHTSLALNLMYHYFPTSSKYFKTLAIYVHALSHSTQKRQKTFLLAVSECPGCCKRHILSKSEYKFIVLPAVLGWYNKIPLPQEAQQSIISQSYSSIPVLTFVCFRQYNMADISLPFRIILNCKG